VEPEVATSLLESIAAERLFVLCGAGLSMADPSNIPSAVRVAQVCRERYRAEVGLELDASLGDDIEAIARHFLAGTSFESLFIAKIVPWSLFKGPPNAGHEALADFLACKVVSAVVTTNLDVLFEKAAVELGEPDFRAIVDEVDLPTATDHGSLLKVHGCECRSRGLTIWCREQLETTPIRERLQAFTTWLAANLRGKDLLVIGFWTDWAYLGELFAANLTAVGPRRVFVINRDGPERLREKAPQLWAWANGPQIQFRHVPQSGDAFLDDLRRIWSARFILRLMDASRPTYERLFGSVPGVPPDLAGGHTSRTLYALRRDLTGTPAARPVRDRAPSDSDHVAAAIHRRLLDLGVTMEPHRYRFRDQSLRVISGRGRLLSAVHADYQCEPPLLTDVDQVICAGAIDDASSPHIVRGAGSGSIVRPGSSATWTTHVPILPRLQVPDDQPS
jgi:hypothetical protein